MKKLMFGLAALCLAFGLVFTVSAFTEKQRVSHWFTFDGTNYQLVDPMNPIPVLCDSDDGTELCAILVDEEKIDYSGPQPQPNTTVTADPENESEDQRYKDER